MQNQKILIYMPDFGQDYTEQIAYLRRKGFAVDWNHEHAQTQDPKVLIADAKGYACVVAASEIWNRQTIDGLAGSVRLIARHGVGVDNIDIPYATSRGIAVTSAPGQLSRSVAEAALGHILCCLRRIARFDREIRGGLYRSVVTHCLTGKTVGLVGFGAIARELAKLLAPFECRLFAYDIAGDPQAARDLGVELVSLSQLLHKADVVSLHLPCNEHTRGMVGRSFLRQMKSSAFLINTSRGGLVVESELKAALDEGIIAGAGLDVFATEHSDEPSVLFGCETAVLTPHAAANTMEAIDKMMWSCARSIEIFFAGGRPDTLLNPDYIHHRT